MDIDDNFYLGKDSMVTMKSKWKIYQREGSILLENISTGEVQFIDLDEEIIELEANGRIGAKVIQLDRQSMREEFN